MQKYKVIKNVSALSCGIENVINVKYNLKYPSKVKAAFFEKPGLENLKIEEFPNPQFTDREVLIKVKLAGVNPIDYFVVSGRHGLKSGPALQARPMPHVPGTELTGTVAKVGSHVKEFQLGDRVIIYPRLFDGTCDFCLHGLEMLCTAGGIIGAVSNGGFAEYVAVPTKNVLKIPDDTVWEVAASLPVTSLTPFHALNEASLKMNEYLLVFGASGNTGTVAVQLGKRMGARVIAISSRDWIKSLEPDCIISAHDQVVEKVREFTQGRMADVVLNSIGAEAWDPSFQSVANNGRLVTFGILTGAQINLDLRSLYNKQIKIIGSTGGSKSELKEIAENSGGIKIKVWKKFKLDDAFVALQALFNKERNGRILLEVS